MPVLSQPEPEFYHEFSKFVILASRSGAFD